MILNGKDCCFLDIRIPLNWEATCDLVIFACTSYFQVSLYLFHCFKNTTVGFQLNCYIHKENDTEWASVLGIYLFFWNWGYNSVNDSNGFLREEAENCKYGEHILCIEYIYVQCQFFTFWGHWKAVLYILNFWALIITYLLVKFSINLKFFLLSFLTFTMLANFEKSRRIIPILFLILSIVYRTFWN